MAREVDQELARGLAAAITELEKRGYSQRDLAERLGVEPATVSRWKTGDRSISLRILPEIDRLCGRPRGHVLRLAGYVEDSGTDVRAAVSADDRLSGADQALLTDIYESMLSRSIAATTPENAADSDRVTSAR